MSIIAISGFSGSGKDTVGKILHYQLSNDNNSVSIEEVLSDYDSHEWWMFDNSGWQIKRWGDNLKQISAILTGIPIHMFEDQEFKKTELGPQWSKYEFFAKNGEVFHIGTYSDISIYNINGYRERKMTVREFLQKLGTDACRDIIHPDVWVNSLISDYHKVINSKFIITDTRFLNEVRAVKEMGGKVIRVNRKGVGPLNNHRSETELSLYKDFDYVIDNDGDISDLIVKVSDMVKTLNL